MELGRSKLVCVYVNLIVGRGKGKKKAKMN